MTFSIKTFLLIFVAAFIVGATIWNLIYIMVTSSGQRSYDNDIEGYTLELKLHSLFAGLLLAAISEFLYFDNLRIARLIESGYLD